MEELPPLFLQRLEQIVPDTCRRQVMDSFAVPAPYVVRINTLKADPATMQDVLEQKALIVESVVGLPAFMLTASAGEDPDIIKMLADGLIYKQSISSMLPAIVLDPRPGDRVLDLCAAPGSKTSQIAAMMQNQGVLVAVEPIRSRYYRLQAVLKQLGVTVAELKCLDGRRFRSNYLFDKILVDAPCSSEGRFKTLDPDSAAYWSLRKIKEMAHKQRGLLLNALRLLRSGGTLVYSTCTFAPEENEGTIDWLLRKSDEGIKLMDIGFKDVQAYPPLSQWEKRAYDSRVLHSCRILPTEKIEGFFIVKIVKD